jgi:L-amino acid N-acyltransferase YncA
MEIRFATADDSNWCAAHDMPAPAEVMLHKIQLREIAVAENAGQRVGFLRLEYMWSRHPFIGLIWIEELHRRQGIGRALLEFIEQELRQKGHRQLLSSSQADEPDSQAWHRSVGFRECGFLAGINEGGVGEVFFAKQLIR